MVHKGPCRAGTKVVRVTEKWQTLHCVLWVCTDKLWNCVAILLTKISSCPQFSQSHSRAASESLFISPLSAAFRYFSGSETPQLLNHLKWFHQQWARYTVLLLSPHIQPIIWWCKLHEFPAVLQKRRIKQTPNAGNCFLISRCCWNSLLQNP